jgi:predicted RNA-binding Zn-ribbon protein involved in translation (DUF1610 family)
MAKSPRSLSFEIHCYRRHEQKSSEFAPELAWFVAVYDSMMPRVRGFFASVMGMCMSTRRDVQPLVYRCPNTGIDIITHILARLGTPVAYLPATAFGLKCPCCGTHHVFQAQQCRSFARKNGPASAAERSAGLKSLR